VRARNLKEIKRRQRSACDFGYVTRNVNCCEMIATNFTSSRDFDLMRHQSWWTLERFDRWISGIICGDVSADIVTNVNGAILYSTPVERTRNYDTRGTRIGNLDSSKEPLTYAITSIDKDHNNNRVKNRVN